MLAPMATRSLQDLYLLLDKAQGRDVSGNALSHDYSSAELREIEAVLARMVQVRELVFKVNQQYIQSAAQDDGYRTEPAFRLQGSYRNMNKLAEKITPVMNDQEMQQMLADHYQGEAQMLTTGAEENLLKLAELRGQMSEEDSARWQQIRQQFLRRQAAGGANADAATRVTAQLVDLVAATREVAQSVAQPQQQAMQEGAAEQSQLLQALQALLARLLQTQSAAGDSLHGIRELMAQRAASEPASTQAGTPSEVQAAQDRQALVHMLGQLLTRSLAQSLEPVVTHLDQARRQQLGLHRVLMQVATRMQEQIDAQRAGRPVPAAGAIRSEEIDKAFERMQRGDVPPAA